jgi:hypothetical protein
MLKIIVIKNFHQTFIFALLKIYYEIEFLIKLSYSIQIMWSYFKLRIIDLKRGLCEFSDQVQDKISQNK